MLRLAWLLLFFFVPEGFFLVFVLELVFLLVLFLFDVFFTVFFEESFFFGVSFVSFGTSIILSNLVFEDNFDDVTNEDDFDDSDDDLKDLVIMDEDELELEQ